MLPRFVHTPEDFNTVVTLGATAESLILEFKRDLDGWKAEDAGVRRDGQKETCRDVSQFANTGGGCLLIGVNEEKRGGQRIAVGVHPLDDLDGRVNWIEQAISNFLVPSTLTHSIVPVALQEGTILAVNIPANRHLVWLWDRDERTMEAVRRTSHGKEYMNPDEVERHLMDGSRAAKIALNAAVEQADDSRASIPVRLAPGIVAFGPNRSPDRRYWPVENQWVGLDRASVGEHEFTLRVGDPMKDGTPIRVPYTLLRAAWLTEDRHVGLILDATIVHWQGGLRLEVLR